MIVYEKKCISRNKIKVEEKYGRFHYNKYKFTTYFVLVSPTVEIRTKFECRKNMSNPLSRTKYLIKSIRGYDDGIML